MRAYKYVDLEVADAVERGSLRIGTLRDFASLEGIRRDESEATITKVVSEMYIHDSEEEKNKTDILREIGIHIKNVKDFHGSNNKKIIRHNNVYTFCMSKNKESEVLKSERPQAVFEITGVRCLAIALAEQNCKSLGNWIVKPVIYELRQREITSVEMSRNFLPDPFVKDSRFAAEEEVRIIWWPRTEPLTSFITEANHEIGQFLKRIA